MINYQGFFFTSVFNLGVQDKILRKKIHLTHRATSLIAAEKWTVKGQILIIGWSGAVSNPVPTDCQQVNADR